MNTNTITICGNVTRDPELKFTSNGTPNVQFGVAVNRRVYNKDGQPQDLVSYMNVVAWSGLAENVCESVRRGTRVVVVGRLDQRSYEKPEVGRVNVFEVVAEEVAASFKWATATVNRITRQAPDIVGDEPLNVVVPDSPAGLAVVAPVGVGSSVPANEEPF